MLYRRDRASSLASDRCQYRKLAEIGPQRKDRDLMWAAGHAGLKSASCFEAGPRSLRDIIPLWYAGEMKGHSYEDQFSLLAQTF